MICFSIPNSQVTNSCKLPNCQVTFSSEILEMEVILLLTMKSIACPQVCHLFQIYNVSNEKKTRERGLAGLEGVEVDTIALSALLVVVLRGGGG